MSQRSNGGSTLTCADCGRDDVQKLICNSDTNGNAGRLYASCSNKKSDGTTCSFFRWCSPKATPVSSPNPSVNTTLPVSAVLNAASSALSRPGCSKPECALIRVAAECRRVMCRGHCIAAGGCSAKGHVATSTTDNRNTRAIASTSRSPSRSLSPPPPGQAAPPTLVQTATTSGSRDAFAHPRYASQMPPVFTQQYAQEQVIEEHRRAADAERLANIQRAKDHVIGYGWAKSGEAF
ncbi:hypothetical protein FPV67DRAFT_1674151 [Lyophyllum atratum]|nr:hypothetical protein FPV67DRAFT_1674151 [Lyophyllum atratum]